MMKVTVAPNQVVLFVCYGSSTKITCKMNNVLVSIGIMVMMM